MTESELRALLLAWPGTAAGIKWQVDLVFTVAGKMFCVWCSEGVDAGRISFKVDDDRFLEFTDRPGIRPAPYMARARWIMLESTDVLPETELRALLRRSYELVFARLTRKLQRELAG